MGDGTQGDVRPMRHHLVVDRDVSHTGCIRVGLTGPQHRPAERVVHRIGEVPRGGNLPAVDDKLRRHGDDCAGGEGGVSLITQDGAPQP